MTRVAGNFWFAHCVGSVAVTVATIVSLHSSSRPAAADENLADRFDAAIAPLLAQRCLECHSTATPRGGLDLSQRESALRGGESGAVLVPGRASDSLLWQHVEANTMPKDRPPLDDQQKDLLRQWIDGGVFWGINPIDPLAYSSERRAGYDWWSLRPVARAAVPPVNQGTWPRQALDDFVLAKLESQGLEPATDADRRTLMRRLYFDLIGLPPEPEAVERFLQDPSPHAYEQLVDQLLASPHYGERWARHWLDVVRYGETQGFERNKIRDNAWRYRDWVIGSFNYDLPFDDFVRQQIAGDLMNPGDYDSLMATGYHVCGTWDQVAHLEGSAMMKVAARQDHVEDLVGTLGQAFLGLTIHCARCHDHKFDPISQRDYYQIAALLAGVHQQEQERRNVVATRDADRQTQLEQHIAEVRQHLSRLETATGHEQSGFERLLDRLHQLESELAFVRFQGAAHVVIPQPPEEVRVLARGDFRQPGDRVAPAGLGALSRAGLAADFGLAADAPESERRIRLAGWLTDPNNPLTARVIVNRLWHYHFGKGLVDTPSDFGFAGGRPSHPELLDYLASRFVAEGWSIKDVQRQIVCSSTYRQASQVKNPHAATVDADNRLLWRFRSRRLEGELVRDSVLAVAGALNLRLGGPSYRDMQLSGGAMGTNSEFTEPTGEFGSPVNRRTIYRLWARSGNHPLLESLDCPDPSVMSPRRSETITPVQALSLWNNALTEKAAEVFAARVYQEAGEPPEKQVERAFQLALSRAPSHDEAALAQRFTAAYGLTQLCLVLLNTNEFLLVN